MAKEDEEVKAQIKKIYRAGKNKNNLKNRDESFISTNGSKKHMVKRGPLLGSRNRSACSCLRRSLYTIMI